MTVVSCDAKFLAPVVLHWELSVPVVIVLLYVQAPLESLVFLVGKQIEIRRGEGKVHR